MLEALVTFIGDARKLLLMGTPECFFLQLTDSGLCDYMSRYKSMCEMVSENTTNNNSSFAAIRRYCQMKLCTAKEFTKTESIFLAKGNDWISNCFKFSRTVLMQLHTELEIM